MKKKIKILIVSHLPMSSTSNVGKTLAQLFDHYPPEDIHQIFITYLDPMFSKCSGFFQVNEFDIVKSIFRLKKVGCEVNDTGKAEEHKPSNNKMHYLISSIYNGKNGRFLRELAWSFGHVNWDKLLKWVKDFNPDVMFLAPGYTFFTYNATMRIHREFGIPYCIFHMDDWYGQHPSTLIDRIRIQKLRHTISDCIKSASCNFTCSEIMAEEYKKEFNKEFITLYTSYVPKLVRTVADETIQKKDVNNTIFLYAGNLGYKRYEILIEIAKAIESNKGKAEIWVYGNCNKQMKEEFEVHPSIKIKGFVDADTLLFAYQHCDVPLHVESFDSYMAEVTRYSISTKVPDILGTGKLVFAIGPSQQASIAYLKKNKAAFVCDDPSQIKEYVDKILQDEVNKETYIQAASKLLAENHDVNRNELLIYSQFEKAMLINEK